MMSEQQQHQHPNEHQHQLYQYSVKIERTAKGARWTVHCYSNDRQIALNEAVQMYDDVGKKLEEQGLAVAPIEKHSSSERIIE